MHRRACRALAGRIGHAGPPQVAREDLEVVAAGRQALHHVAARDLVAAGVVRRVEEPDHEDARHRTSVRLRTEARSIPASTTVSLRSRRAVVVTIARGPALERHAAQPQPGHPGGQRGPPAPRDEHADDPQEHRDVGGPVRPGPPETVPAEGGVALGDVDEVALPPGHHQVPAQRPLRDVVGHHGGLVEEPTTPALLRRPAGRDVLAPEVERLVEAARLLQHRPREEQVAALEVGARRHGLAVDGVRAVGVGTARPQRGALQDAEVRGGAGGGDALVQPGRVGHAVVVGERHERRGGLPPAQVARRSRAVVVLDQEQAQAQR